MSTVFNDVNVYAKLMFNPLCTQGCHFVHVFVKYSDKIGRKSNIPILHMFGNKIVLLHTD